MAGEEVIANISSNVTDAVSNATIVSDGTFFGTYFPIIKERTIALITAPAGTPEMLWIVFPLLVSVRTRVRFLHSLSKTRVRQEL